MEDYLDEDNDAMKMIKSSEFTSTFDQFMENIKKKITNVEIEKNELLDEGRRGLSTVIANAWRIIWMKMTMP